MGIFGRGAMEPPSTAEGVPIPDGAVDVRARYPEAPSERQRWILGLSTLVIDPGTGGCARLHPSAFVHPRTTSNDYRLALKALWNIASETDLLQALSWLLRTGQRSRLAAQLGHPPLAWDLARVAVLPRRAFAAGFIDSATAWELMEAAVEPAVRAYDSWGSFVRDGLAGHNAWTGHRQDWMDRHVVRWWSPSMQAESPWQSVAWEAGRLEPAGSLR